MLSDAPNVAGTLSAGQNVRYVPGEDPKGKGKGKTKAVCVIPN